MKKIFLSKSGLIMVALALIVVLAGCGTKPAELKKIKVGFMPVADCLPLFVAQEKGFFTGEGLAVEAKSMEGGAVIGPAVEAGDLDIGWSNIISMSIGHEKGSDFKYLAAGAYKDEKSVDFFQIVVAKDSRLSRPKDLEGKTIAINTFKNIVEIGLRMWADKNNVNYSKIKVVEVPFPQMESALENKEIDAAMFVEPYPTLSLSSGVAKTLDKQPFDAVAPKLMIASWFAKESWVKNNLGTTAAFVRAVNKAVDYINANRAEMSVILPKYTRLTQEVADKITMPTFQTKIDLKDLQVMIDASQKYGYITNKFDAGEIVVNLAALSQ